MGVGQFKSKFQVEWDITTKLRWYQKTRMINSYMRYQNIDSTFYSFVKKHACDRRTDRITIALQELGRFER